MEEAVSDRRKDFGAAHRSDEDCQAYVSASRHASSVITKAKAEASQATCPFLSPKSNPKSVYSLLVLSMALLLSHLPRLLTSLTVPFPRVRLRSSPIN